MELSYYIQQLPKELKNMIYWQCFEGSANRVFKEYLKENLLFKNNLHLQSFKPNPHYTLAQYLIDIKIIKRYGRELDSDEYDIVAYANFIINHVFVLEDSEDSENESEDDNYDY